MARTANKGTILDREDIKALLDKNFLEIWTLYLEQNIARQKKQVQLTLSPTRALIAQCVYWHELLLLSEEDDDCIDIYENFRDYWRAFLEATKNAIGL